MCASIRMLNLAISEPRSTAKQRNMDSHKCMSRKELQDVISKTSVFPPRPIKHKSIYKPAHIKHRPLIKIDASESVPKDYKPKMTAVALNDGYIE